MNKKFIQVVFSFLCIPFSVCASEGPMQPQVVPQVSQSHGNVVAIKNAAELDSYINSGNFVVVYFSSLTCGPCVQFNPAYLELAAENPDVVFVKVVFGSVEGGENLINKFVIRSFPTFLFFDKQGKKTNSFDGGSDRTKMKISNELVKLREGKSTQLNSTSQRVSPENMKNVPMSQPVQQKTVSPVAQSRTPNQVASPSQTAQPRRYNEQAASSVAQPQRAPHQTASCASGPSQLQRASRTNEQMGNQQSRSKMRKKMRRPNTNRRMNAQ